MIYDLTLPISRTMPVWPGDPEVMFVPAGENATAGGPSVSRLCMGTHTGTHVDPPAHFIAGARTADELPLDVLVGPAWVAHLPGRAIIRLEDLVGASIVPGATRLLLRTDNSDRAIGRSAFDPDFVGLSEDGARWLLASGIRLVGIDAPSIEPFLSPGERVHRLLLEAGAVIVEGLVMDEIAAGPYRLCCLPLRLARGDGAPARVVLFEDVPGA